MSLTFSDISTQVVNALRIDSGNTTQVARIDALINDVYRDIHAKQDWWWALKRTETVTLYPKLTGTATVTQESLTVTPSAALSFTGDINTIGTFIVDGSADDGSAVYRVGSTASPSPLSVFNLASIYTGVTSTDAAYTIYRDWNILPSDLVKLLSVTRYGSSRPLERLGLEEMQRRKQVDRSEGPPLAYSIYDRFTTGVQATDSTDRILIVYPYPDKFYHLDILYKYMSSSEISGTAAATQPLIPNEYRHVLVYGALSRCYPIFLNDLERGAYYLSMFNDVMALMSAQQREYASSHPGINPSADLYRRASTRGRTRHTSLGRYFDILPLDP